MGLQIIPLAPTSSSKPSNLALTLGLQSRTPDGPPDEGYYTKLLCIQSQTVVQHAISCSESGKCSESVRVAKMHSHALLSHGMHACPPELSAVVLRQQKLRKQLPLEALYAFGGARDTNKPLNVF